MPRAALALLPLIAALACDGGEAWHASPTRTFSTPLAVAIDLPVHFEEAAGGDDAVVYAGALARLVAHDEPISTLPVHARAIRTTLADGSALAVLDRLIVLSRQR